MQSKSQKKYWVEYRKLVGKQYRNSPPNTGKRHTTKTFSTLPDAMVKARDLESKNHYGISIIDGTNVINHKQHGYIGISGKYHQGV